MNVLVLGHFYVELAGHRVAPRAAKQRQILATLAARGNDVVSTDELCRELWGPTAPQTAGTTIHVYVSQIRKSLGRAGGGAYDPKDVLRTTRGGYLLDLDGGRSDLAEFDATTAQGYAARADGEFGTASALFGRALDLWRGPAFADVAGGAVLAPVADRLDEVRRLVQERRIDADLRLGRHHQLGGELAGLVVRHPTDEGLHAQLMLTLSRCGRRDDALAVYRRLKDRLGAHAGLAPSAETDRLARSILTSSSRPAPAGAGRRAGAGR